MRMGRLKLVGFTTNERTKGRLASMFRFTIRDLLWLMVVVGLACLTISRVRQFSALQTSVKDLSAKTAAQRQEIHELKERELALILAVEEKYNDRIAQWSLWRDPDHPYRWCVATRERPYHRHHWRSHCFDHSGDDLWWR